MWWLALVDDFRTFRLADLNQGIAHFLGASGIKHLL